MVHDTKVKVAKIIRKALKNYQFSKNKGKLSMKYFFFYSVSHISDSKTLRKIFLTKQNFLLGIFGNNHNIY